MDSNYKYSLYRVNMLLTLFRSDYAIYTITELSEMLEVPKSVIREDIYILSKGVDECETVIFSYDDEDMEDEEFFERLKKGLEDDTPLGAYSRFSADMFLPLSKNELDVLDDFYPDKQFGMKFSESGLYIKKSPYKEDPETLVKIAELNEHILKGHNLNVSYPAKDGSMRKLIFRPLCIVRYNLENVSFVVSVKAGHIFPLRIDRIKSIETAEDDNAVIDYSPLSKLPLMWKMDTGEEVNVKIRILAPKRIRDKIKNDIFNMRITYESIASSELKSLINVDEKADIGIWSDIDENTSEFSGRVCGVSAFRNWINGYGSSIVVLEPESLRNEIIESAKLRCKKYSVS